MSERKRRSKLESALVADARNKNSTKPLHIPDWLDHEHPPSDDETGQAIWILGQWKFIPFYNGVPLRRLCDSLISAHNEVNDFRKSREGMHKLIAKYRSENRLEFAETLRFNSEKFFSSFTLELVLSPSGDISSCVFYRLAPVTSNANSDDRPHVVVGPDGRILKFALPNYAAAVAAAETSF